MIGKYLAMGIAAAAACGSTAAMAAGKPAPSEYVMKYSGVVAAGSDSLNLFGGDGRSLVGQSYSETFVVLAKDVKSVTGGEGGEGFGASDPILSATLTIDGDSIVLTPSRATADGVSAGSVKSAFGAVAAIDKPKGLLFDSQSDAVCQGGQCETYTIAAGILDPISGAAFPTTLNDDWNIKAKGDVVDGGSLFLVGGLCGDQEKLVLNVTSAAPEPGTWVLMLAGVGLLGMTLRSRGTYRPAAAIG